jgi:hypothetical protein
MNDSEQTFDAFPFTISELIKDLETIKDKHGDLQIAVRSIDDRTGLVRHAEGIGIWVFSKKDASFLDRTDETLEDKFLSLG